jgi:hypothetical protein
MPILRAVETPEFLEPGDPPERRPPRPAPPSEPRPQPFQHRPLGIWGVGERMSWVAGLVLALSSFMSWYSGKSPEGPTESVIGWHTGVLGKLVFFVGLAIVALAVLREAGIELPPALPESLVIIALGALGTIFALIRLISIPETFAGTGRGIGIWISLFSALAVILAGLFRAGEEL